MATTLEFGFVPLTIRSIRSRPDLTHKSRHPPPQLPPKPPMDTQIIHTTSGALTFIGLVDKRILSLLKSTHANNPVLIALHNGLLSLRKTLIALSSALKNDGFKKSILTELSTKTATLFNYITTVLLATINGLQKLEAAVKKATSGSKSLFGKKAKGLPTIDDDLAIYQDRIQHLDLALSVAENIIECDTTTSNPKLHIHDVKAHIHALADKLAELQTTTLNLNITTPSRPDGSKVERAYLTDFDGIASNAAELASAAMIKTDTDMVKVHSGFVPMSPLIEVMSRTTLQPCPTIESIFELEKVNTYEPGDSEESSAATSTATTPSASRAASRASSPARAMGVMA